MQTIVHNGPTFTIDVRINPSLENIYQKYIQICDILQVVTSDGRPYKLCRLIHCGQQGLIVLKHPGTDSSWLHDGF